MARGWGLWGGRAGLDSSIWDNRSLMKSTVMLKTGKRQTQTADTQSEEEFKPTDEPSQKM